MIEQEAVLSPPARLRGLRPASAGKFPYAVLRIKRKPGEKILWLFHPIGKFSELPYWTKTLRGMHMPRQRKLSAYADARQRGNPASGILFYNTSFLSHVLSFLFMTEHRLQTDV
ncbi:MAG: hypothetical protein LUH20_10390 [Lachnospiraceae bacterium]|nr:hypothetical protein [Lachnospiraceae bacterium]